MLIINLLIISGLISFLQSCSLFGCTNRAKLMLWLWTLVIIDLIFVLVGYGCPVIVLLSIFTFLVVSSISLIIFILSDNRLLALCIANYIMIGLTVLRVLYILSGIGMSMCEHFEVYDMFINGVNDILYYTPCYLWHTPKNL